MISKRRALAFVFCSIVLTSIAQVSFKLALLDVGQAAGHASDWQAILTTANWPVLIAGIALYGTSLVCWILALSRLPVGAAYPMLSLSYVVVYVAATRLPGVGEVGSGKDMVALGLILCGVYLLSTDRSLDEP